MSGVRVVNLHREECDVYIGRAAPRRGLRASVWANPFRIGPDGDRRAVLLKYRQYIAAKLASDPSLRAQLRELAGKRLGCWCKPEPCHGDVLVELIREETCGDGD